MYVLVVAVLKLVNCNKRCILLKIDIKHLSQRAFLLHSILSLVKILFPLFGGMVLYDSNEFETNESKNLKQG